MSPGTPSLSMFPRNPGKALIVDDEENIRGLYAEVLEAMGFQVETAPDGLKGLERIQAGPYNLVISDIRMPGLTGVEFYLKAAQARPGSEQRFIFTTGLIDSLNAHEYMIVTEKPCIVKPAKVENIQQAVLELYARRDSGSRS
ncbi:MAG TPA: response regulator [Candidatus Polarisedimenticolia bacterium]|nr:response regulator [Candidatus Polarisedimenticolia bacterium]